MQLKPKLQQSNVTDTLQQRTTAETEAFVATATSATEKEEISPIYSQATAKAAQKCRRQKTNKLRNCNAMQQSQRLLNELPSKVEPGYVNSRPNYASKEAAAKYKHANSIISITEQQQQQKPPPPSSPSTTRSYPSAPMLQRIPYIFLLSCAMLLLHGHLPAVYAGCRDEQSRSCEVICSGDGADGVTPNCTIRALVLLPDDDSYVASLRRVLPILKVAEQKIRKAQLIPAHIQFEWMPQDDKCDAAFAVIKAMDGIVKNCAHVIFGPVCDYPLAAVSRIAKYFNSNGTPLITVGGSTYDFEKKKTSCADEFYMLLRTGMLSFETISEMTISVMKRYNWSHSIFFYERDGQKNVAGLHTCFLMMNSLGKQMRKENMTFAQYPLNANSNRSLEMEREIGNKHSKVNKFQSAKVDLNIPYNLLV